MQEAKHINVIFQLELETFGAVSIVVCTRLPLPTQSALSHVRFVLCLCCCFSLFSFRFFTPFFSPQLPFDFAMCLSSRLSCPISFDLTHRLTLDNGAGQMEMAMEMEMEMEIV